MDSITLEKGNHLLKLQKEHKIQIERIRTILVDKTADTLKIMKAGGTSLIIISANKEIIKSTLELLLIITEKKYIEVSRQLEAL